MEVKIEKRHPNAVIPKYAKIGDAGMDLTAVSREFDGCGNVVYDTGLAFEIPTGYVGLVFPRSSICKKELSLTNAVGVIDSGYRGTVSAKFKIALSLDGVDANNLRMYDVGDRIAQMIIIPYPQITFKEVEFLSETERGTNGYGSSGK